MNTEKEYITSFQLMFTGVPLAAILVDNDGRLLNANASASAYFGIPETELEGRLWTGLDARLTQFSWSKHWKALQKEKIVLYETDIVTNKDFLRPVTVNLSLAGKNWAVISLKDRFEEQMQDAKLRLVEDSMSVGSWSYNRLEGRITLSAEARRLLGIPEANTNKLDLIAGVRARMGETEFKQLARIAEDLLIEAGVGKHSLYLQNESGTSRLRIVGRSVGNDLHVTHAFGIVRDDSSTEDEADISGEGKGISNELARFSIDQAKDMIFWARPDGTLSYVNPTVSKKLGYSRTELQQMKIIDFAPFFDEEARAAFWEQLRAQKSFDANYPLTTRDGKVMEISAAVNYLLLEGEEFACSICRDITQNHNKQRRQRLTEFTVDHSNDMIIWTGPGGVIHNANDTLLKFTGYTDEEFSQLKVKDFSPDENPEDSKAYWDRIRSGETVTYDTIIRKKDGTLIPVQATLNYINFEGEEYNCVYLRDLRLKKARDRQIELSQVALDQAADCILWLDENLNIHYANQTILDLVHVKDWKGKTVKDMLPGIQKALIAPGSNHDFKLRTPQGKERQLNLHCKEMVHDGNKFYALVGRDVTVLIERQQKLEHAKAQIEDLKNRLEEENTRLREDVSFKYNIDKIITVSPKYQQVLRQIGQVANVDTTVLIVGETGTGKELLARAVHQLSKREDDPLVKVNCAALPAELIESELFGHEKGAFTGAIARKKGRFELADKGTIFLDEIGEMPIELQPKLLRALQEGEFERVGGTETIKVDTRLIAATNRDLEKMITQGTFREDLYYRLNVFPIYNIPLRERPEDIPVLVEFFIRKFARKQGKDIREVNTADLKKLRRYAFPGNIRELENLIERSVVLCQSHVLNIELDHLRSKRKRDKKEGEFLPFEAMQRNYLIEALKLTGGRITGPEGAGVLLGLNDRTLMSKLRKFQIEKYEYITRD